MTYKRESEREKNTILIVAADKEEKPIVGSKMGLRTQLSSTL